MDQIDLKKLYEEGFAPGPEESVEAFSKRVHKTKELFLNPSLLAEKLDLPKESFYLDQNLLISKTDKGLLFWHRAMTLICEIEEDLYVSVVQIPERKISWIKGDEILLHEKVHALRALFGEPQFEELLAYQTSPFLYRRLLGPLFKTNRESLLFLVFAFLGFFALLIYNSPLFFLPFFLLLAFLFSRLTHNHILYALAKRHLKKKTAHFDEILPLLTDYEIKEIAKGRFDSLKKNDLRWKLIEKLFP